MNENSRIPVILLPGIIMPAALRYVPLLRELGDSVDAVTKELEVYAGEAPPEDYSIESEVTGISRAADAAGFDRFHLYGHSGGGACALAYIAAHPERVLSLAVDEPATDFSPEEQAEMREVLQRIGSLPPSERMREFLQWQVAPGVFRCHHLPPVPHLPGWRCGRPASMPSWGQLPAIVSTRSACARSTDPCTSAMGA